MEKMTGKGNVSTDSPDLHEMIRQRAEEIYIRNGRLAGYDVENWTQAERQILAEAVQSRHRRAIVVQVNGVRYIGEYRPESSGGYEPGEIVAGSSVSVRLQGDKMFVRRPNGKELETRILKKMG
jgi:hypothetical protein